MKAATVKEIKEELETLPKKELVELALGLARFKKENKELLTYLLYEAANEDLFIAGVKKELDESFGEINTKSFYLMKKSIRKILRITKKYIRYSKKKETDIALRIYFCQTLKNLKPSIASSVTMTKMYEREISSITKIVKTLHEDLQWDFEKELEDLTL
jgi:hypothetical protein